MSAYRIPAIRVQTFIDEDEKWIDIDLNEKSLTTANLMTALPALHSAVTVIWDWIKYGEQVRDAVVVDKARELVKNEKYGKVGV